MAKININLKALETMNFIWASLSDKEKISDILLNDLANSDEMLAAYDDEFTKESLRKVLSAISNRELLNSPNKKESRFWNYNMWMLEDRELCNDMLNPIKKLNLDEIANSSGLKDGVFDVIFYPGHLELSKLIVDKLFINFFLIKPSQEDKNSIMVDNKTIAEFLIEKLSN